ncbi:hypothetical protein ACFUCV_09685 [Specibacter sp. NPDC057265]|uniref:hypothetical protein n=1 Tax=Specibacter sp. NPDC057265 TaxID=3346075 RepID=UPI00362C8408
MTQQHTSAAQASKAPGAASTAVAGPLTLRDLVVLGAVAIIFIASVVPMIETLTGDLNLWNVAGLFYLTIGVILPLVVAALFLVRRLSPEVKIRIGSLSVDQFASVVAAFAAFFFFVGTVSNFKVAYLVGLIGSLVLLLATVCARWLPFFATDFANRVEVPAHVAARDAVAATKRPSAPKPVTPQAHAGGQTGPATGAQGAQDQYAPAQAAVQNAPQAQNTQGAWAGPQAGNSPAGQIFTPAKAAGASTGATAAGAGQDQSAASPAANAAGTAAPTAAHPRVSDAAAASAGKPAGNTAGAPAAAAAATPAAAATGRTADAAAPAARTTESAATTLNPQVAEPVQERSEPAKRESIAATVSPARAAAVAEPFWFAVDRPQNVIDEKTRQFVFKLMPGAWILALEDRGESFLVQDSNGKTGLLLDLVGIERASDSQ